MAPVRIPYDAEDARRARGDEDVTPQFQACEGEPPTHRARPVTCRDDGRSFPAASQSVAHRRSAARPRRASTREDTPTTEDEHDTPPRPLQPSSQEECECVCVDANMSQPPPTPPHLAGASSRALPLGASLRRQLEEVQSPPASPRVCVEDLRLPVVEDAAEVVARVSVNDLGHGSQTVEEYEKNPDAQMPGKGSGIQISLDGLGAVIPAARNRVDKKTMMTQQGDRSDVEKGGSLRRKLSGGTGNKVLLEEVTGTIFSGDMCAVMGPSGAGKTTLLDIISKRKTEGKILGKVYFDGSIPSTSTVKKYTAYIQQQDCFFGGATVYETILFAAMAKLVGSSKAKVAEKHEKVKEVIQQLNLQRCAHTYMGNRLIRGVSGGEMKRTAVACALLINPQCMFLDEPTSGLDSAMAQEVIINLRALQLKQGCTFVVTIHQPAPAVFDAFNRLVLLNYGRVAYFGPGRAAPLEFFAAQGFPYRSGYNAAEYLIDTLNQHGVATGGEHDFEAYYATSELCAANAASVQETALLSQKCTEGAMSRQQGDGHVSKFANTHLRELWVLLRYKALSRVRHPLFLVTRVGLYVLLAGLLSSFFYGQDRQVSGILNVVGILFISVILPCFMAQVFVEEMKFDREVYTREFNDAYYRAGTYVAQRVMTEMSALVLAVGSFSAILYWSVELNDNLAKFGFFVLTTGVNFTIAMLVGFTIASGITGEVGPAVILPVFTTLNMLVGGFFIRKATIHAIWIWLYWISFIQWTWSALMVNEFEGMEYSDHCNGNNDLLELFDTMPLTLQQKQAIEIFQSTRQFSTCTPILGDSVLASFELDGRNKWISLGWSACAIPVFIITFYIGVRFVKHEKR